MINIILIRKDGATLSAMKLAQAADAVERTLKIFMCDSTRCDPEHFRQFADEIEKKAKQLARLSREWADGLDAYREKAESPNEETCEVKRTNPAVEEKEDLQEEIRRVEWDITELCGSIEQVAWFVKEGRDRPGDKKNSEELLSSLNKAFEELWQLNAKRAELISDCPACADEAS